MLQILRTFTGLLANEAAAPVLLGMLAGVVEACSSASESVFEEIVSSLHTMAKTPRYRAAMQKEGVVELLVSRARGTRDAGRRAPPQRAHAGARALTLPRTPAFPTRRA